MNNVELIDRIIVALGDIEIKGKYSMQMAGILEALATVKQNIEKGENHVSDKT